MIFERSWLIISTSYIMAGCMSTCVFLSVCRCVRNVPGDREKLSEARLFASFNAET